MVRHWRGHNRRRHRPAHDWLLSLAGARNRAAGILVADPDWHDDHRLLGCRTVAGAIARRLALGLRPMAAPSCMLDSARLGCGGIGEWDG